MDLFKVITYHKSRMYTGSSILINTSLDYVPLFLIPKVILNTGGNYINTDLFNSSFRSKFSSSLISNKCNKLNVTLRNTTAKRIFLDKLLSDEVGLTGYNNVFKELTNFLHSPYFAKIENNRIVTVSQRTNDLTHIKYTFQGEYLSNAISNFTYLSSINKNVCVDEGFLGKDFNGIGMAPLYMLMVKKDYVEEYILNRLLEKPIDNSQLQWWANSSNPTSLDKSWKLFCAHFVNIIKNTPFEVVAKDNLESLFKSFKKPEISSISAITSFNKNLTEHVLKVMYNENIELPTLGLELNKEEIKTVPLKGIRLNKKPELVD